MDQHDAQHAIEIEDIMRLILERKRIFTHALRLDKILEEDELAYIVGVSYEAGSDTTAFMLEILVMAVVLYPQLAHHVRREVDTVVEAQLPNFEDIRNLPFLRAYVLELLRWRPVVPGGIQHATSADDYYRGYHIPKGLKGNTLPNPDDMTGLLCASDIQGGTAIDFAPPSLTHVPPVDVAAGQVSALLAACCAPKKICSAQFTPTPPSRRHSGLQRRSSDRAASIGRGRPPRQSIRHGLSHRPPFPSSDVATQSSNVSVMQALSSTGDADVDKTAAS
ncbi:hypothetical protein ARSEF1564_005234 [Beauveria bassiana]